MSTERHNNGGTTFVCDSCGQYINPPRSTERLEFRDCWELAKDKGWRAVKVPSRVRGQDDWEHRCGEC